MVEGEEPATWLGYFLFSKLRPTADAGKTKKSTLSGYVLPYVACKCSVLFVALYALTLTWSPYQQHVPTAQS